MCCWDVKSRLKKAKQCSEKSIEQVNKICYLVFSEIQDIQVPLCLVADACIKRN